MDPYVITQITQWERDGIFTPEKILSRMKYGGDADSPIYGSKYLEKIIQEFNEFSIEKDNITCWDKPASLRFFLEKFPSAAPAIEASSPILFNILSYLSNYPFTQISESTITLEGLITSLSWMSPIISNSRFLFCASCIGNSISVRQRTSADDRRLIFQSLALQEDSIIVDIDTARQFAAEKAHITENPEFDKDWLETNSDEDGDQLFHDTLDIISATLPCKVWGPFFVRNDLRDLAKRLFAHDSTTLAQMIIPIETFTKLIKLVLSIRNVKSILDSQDLERVVNSVLNGFGSPPNAGINYFQFESTICDKMPFFLDALYQLFTRFISSPTLYSDPIPFSSDKKVLSPAIISQLSLFLRDDISFDYLSLSYHFTLPLASNSSTSFIDLVDVFNDRRQIKLILILGETYPPARTKVVVGGYFSNEDNIPGLLFQLAPEHDIFHPTVTSCKKVAMERNGGEEIWIGQPFNGFSIGISRDTDICTIMHHVKPRKEEDEAEIGIYKASADRGNWIIGIHIEKIEIWTEDL